MGLETRDIEEIKSRLNIVEIIGRYVRLKRVGNRWIGPCPFHAETKPSFSVTTDPDLYYCFGCQAGGDVIRFFQEINGLEFQEAVEQLAREAGVTLRTQAPGQRRKAGERQIILDMNSRAQMHFRANLSSRPGAVAREYLSGRGVNKACAESFGLGFALDEWRALLSCLEQNGFNPQDGIKAGLLASSERGRIYDRFRKRIMFPIQDPSGRIVAFGGRILEGDGPKYINSSESAVFTKGEHLYGLYQARAEILRTKTAMITEGYLDVMALHQHGFTNACGVLGTALTPAHVRRLAGLARQVELLFDADRAGTQAAFRGAQSVLAQGLQCTILDLPAGEDADSLLRAKGAQALEKIRAKALDGFAFCMHCIRQAANPAEIMTRAVDFIRNLARMDLQAYYLPRLASELRLSENELRRTLQQKNSRTPLGQGAASTLTAKAPSQRDRILLEFSLRHNDLINELAAQGMEHCLTTERGRAFWAKLVAHGAEDVVVHLDEGERDFYYSCLVSPSAERTVEEKSRECEEIRAFLRSMFWKRRLNMLKLALSSAERANDTEEINRLLKQIQEAKDKTSLDADGS